MDENNFKQCPGCDKWFSMRDFLENPQLRPLGLTFESADYDENLFYFTHIVNGCGTTFVIPAARFIPAIDEPIPALIKTGSENCEGRCVHLEDWIECRNDCFHAPFRRLLRQMAQNRGIPMREDSIHEKTRP